MTGMVTIARNRHGLGTVSSFAKVMDVKSCSATGSRVLGFLLASCLAMLFAMTAVGQDAGDKVTVRLVPVDAADRIASDLESLVEIVKTTEAEGKGGRPKVETVGEKAVLWVRNATVDNKHGFERYYEGKYINRKAELTLDADQLAQGGHFINPGRHEFEMRQDGTVSSDDPEIEINGRVVSLKVYGIDIMAIDSLLSGPPEQRLVPAEFGLYLTRPDVPITSDSVPNPTQTDKPLTNLLSHARTFYPLRVYLPANTRGEEYVLYPYGQAFQVLPGGKVALKGLKVAGVESEEGRILVSFTRFRGRLEARQGLSAGVGSVPVPHGTRKSNRMSMEPTVEDVYFTGGFGLPSKTFRIRVDNDFSRNPNKYFVADNMDGDVHNVRLMALEWDLPVFEAGKVSSVSLRFMENHREIWDSDVKDWQPVVDALWKHGEQEGDDPLTRVRRNLEAVNGSVTERWLGLKDPPKAGDRKTKESLLVALNMAMHFPGLCPTEIAASLDLPKEMKVIAGNGVAQLAETDLLKFNRGLLSVLFPGALADVDRTPTVPDPEVRLAYSPYFPQSPGKRSWTRFSPESWQDGKLSFVTPKLSYGFYVFRVMVFARGDDRSETSLSAELFGCVVAPGQTGTASFISNKGRDAFVAGEQITLDAVIRSRQKGRAAGRPVVVLKHPDGRVERSPFADRGGDWCSSQVVLRSDVTRRMAPGRYEMTFEDLPDGIVAWPLVFDLADTQRESLYTIIKPSKYTGDMNGLVASWIGGYMQGKTPVDLDRAVATIAELGYNRIDLMTYSTYNHVRTFTERENVAERDARLMAPDSVYTPCARDQILNACVRHRIEFSDVLLTYNDFQLPRYIDGYVEASERWISREVSSMRHSPAFAGMMLYDEMYETGLMGVPEKHTTLFPRLRLRKAEEVLGASPSDIRNKWMRDLKRPPGQRDPENLRRFLEFRKWELHGWGDYNGRLAKAARLLAPRARIGTYYTSFLYVTTGLGSVVSGVDMDNGYHPDVFQDLDILSSVHYTDNAGGWVHSCMIVPLLRFGARRPVWVNIPVSHEVFRGRSDGQYQRQMAFAMLSQGADGVSQWGLKLGFSEEPNKDMLKGKETTKYLNTEILAPFGEIVTATEPGYEDVAIVLTANQMILSEVKKIRTANQAEELWVACWRLGFSAQFLREDAFEQPLDKYKVIFVPGIRFKGELTPAMVKSLEEASKRGAKIVVEKGSVLDFPGIVRMDDFAINDYYLGAAYAPSYQDDELNRVYKLSQPATDYLATKLPKWIEPTASGPFRVGPNWWSSGDLHYLVMADFDDPEYGHTVKQFMAKPVVMPLKVSSSRGSTAYDLLAGRRLELREKGDHVSFDLDMTEVQGGIVAFTPEPVAGIHVSLQGADDRAAVRITAGLTGESGQTMQGVFPARILVRGGGIDRTYYRAIGPDRSCVLALPPIGEGKQYSIQVRESISGQSCTVPLASCAPPSSCVEVLDDPKVLTPFPSDVKRFLKQNRRAVLVVSRDIPGIDKAAETLVDVLTREGWEIERKDESDAFSFVSGDPTLPDPMADGFHSWRSGNETIQPAASVDSPVILMACRNSSYLLDSLSANGFLSYRPAAGQGTQVSPSIQVAVSGLHWKYDTLCLVANDAEGMLRAAEALTADMPVKPIPPSPTFSGSVVEAVGDALLPVEPALDYMGNNEMVSDIDFDAAGNLYLTTWGHGDNIFSLDPMGKVRFSKYLPAFGTYAMSVQKDRVLAYTVSGARLYQVGLNGKPISQMRLPSDVGWRRSTSGYPINHTVFCYSPQTGCVVYHAAQVERMRVIGPDGKLVSEWEGDEYSDPEGPEATPHRKFHGFAISPDGKRIVQAEYSRYVSGGKQTVMYGVDSFLVIRDLNGKKLAEYAEVLANERQRPTAQVEWNPGESGPAVILKGEKLKFDEKLKLIGQSPWRSEEFSFGKHGVLVRDGQSFRYINRQGREVTRFGPFETMPGLVVINAKGSMFLFVDQYGLAMLCDSGTGKLVKQFRLDQFGDVVKFSPDDLRIYVGGFRGSVVCYDLDGKLLWRTSLREHNKSLRQELGRISSEFPDYTENIWPMHRDEPGQLDKLVRFDASRIVNGNCESTQAWEGDSVTNAAEGLKSAKSLLVGENAVQQQVTGLVGDHFTYVLEFYYKEPRGKPGGELLAGIRSDSKYSLAVARHFTAGPDWQYARIVTKSGMEAKGLSLGFRSENGETLVDSVSLRRIRFPSVNQLFYEPIHEITPEVLANPLYSELYDPLGNLRDEAPARIIVENIVSGGLNLVESGFLQNGRLNDMGNDWYIKPLQGNDTEISIGFSEPRWISMVGLYFNAYDEENATRHFDIYVTDIETGKRDLVAKVRNNAQLFYLAKFPPHKAVQIDVDLINAIPRYRTVTEIEAYGPLSGKEGAQGFVDSDGQNTYMGNFARVDKRRKVIHQSYTLAASEGSARAPMVSAPIWSFPCSQPIVAEGQLYLSRALGHNQRWVLDSKDPDGSMARSCSLGFGPYITLYGGVLLKPGTDGNLYCIDPASSRELWRVRIGERLTSAPVARDTDILAASDTGHLYSLDLASGTVLRETSLSGGVAGSLVLDGSRLIFITDDGKLQAVDSRSWKKLWELDIAAYSESTPAVDNGNVYMADQKGTARAVTATTGKVVWTTELGQEFTRCPVVTDKEVLFGCRDGKLAVLNRENGKVMWEKQTGSRFNYEPLVVEADRHEPEKNKVLCDTDFSVDGVEIPAQLKPLLCRNPTATTRSAAPANNVVRVENGALVITGNEEPSLGLAMLKWAGKVGKDVRIECTVENSGSVILTTAGDGLTGYRAVLSFNQHRVSLDTVNDLKWKELAEGKRPLSAKAEAFDITLDKIGDRIRILVDGEVYVDYQAPNPYAGPGHDTFSIGSFTETCRCRKLKVTQVLAPERRWTERSVLYFDGKSGRLADMANGNQRDWEVMIHKGLEVEKKTVTLGDVPWSSISYYMGQLFVTTRQMDSGHNALSYNGTYHQWTAGGVTRLVPHEVTTGQKGK